MSTTESPETLRDVRLGMPFIAQSDHSTEDTQIMEPDLQESVIIENTRYDSAQYFVENSDIEQEGEPTEGYPDIDWSKLQNKNKVPSQKSTTRLERTLRSNKSHDQSQVSQRAYITEFSDDGDSDLERETVGSVNVLGEDDESFDDNSLPPPEDAVDIDNPDGYDTDLEIDREEFLNEGEKHVYDATGIKDYIKRCNSLGVIPVSYFQRHVHDQEFVMRNHGLGPIGAKAISKPLEGNTVIESLDLEGNDIRGAGSMYLSHVLRDNCYITNLVLAENGLGSVGCQTICEMLRENTTVQDVDLSGNGFKDSDGESIYRLIEGNRSICSLKLRHNEFEVESARWIKDAMIANVSLRKLDLSWNHFRLKGAYYLAEMIQENYGLKFLNLAMNGFGNEGASAMGRALGHNQCIEEINLSNNRIADMGAEDIAKGMLTNETLTTLRIGMNPISPTGTLPLIKAIYKNKNTSISLLDMTNIVVTDEFDALLIQQTQEKSKELQVIHGGVLFKKKQLFSMETDLETAYESDPMTKLKKFAEKTKLRLVDVFRQFDKDQSMTLSEDEFLRSIATLKKHGFELTSKDVQTLMQRLDSDGDGELDYADLVEGANENRKARRRVLEWKNTKDEGVQVDPFDLTA